MIIEGLMTTEAADGSPHLAPLGPVVDESLEQWLLRPFQSSNTFANLRRTGLGTFHVVDDILPVVQSALSLPVDLEFIRNEYGGWIIASACHWYSLNIQQWDVSQSRAEAAAQVIASGNIRPFWGWNRAKHAVLEATILATRLHLNGPESIAEQLELLEVAVEKTAGPRETEAWNLVKDYIQNWKPS
jgi:uncharacterized protein